VYGSEWLTERINQSPATGTQQFSSSPTPPDRLAHGNRQQAIRNGSDATPAVPGSPGALSEADLPWQALESGAP